MSKMNMSYCRFENTSQALQECLDNWDLNEDASDYEIRGKKDIIEMAKEIIRLEDLEEEFRE